MSNIYISIFIIYFISLTFNLNAQSKIDADTIPENIIYVNKHHVNANNLNSGLKEFPIKDLQKAIDICKNLPSKIIIAPGHYRSYIDIHTNELLILEAEQPGSVYISGSDVFSDWEKHEVGYWHEWPYKWGFFEDSAACFGDCNLTDYQKRREMVFVDGTPLQQVLAYDELIEGAFYINEELGKIHILLDEDNAPENFKIEVSTRGYDIYDLGRNGTLVKATVYNQNGLIIKGIVFQHVANTMHQDALTISNTDNIVIENCIFQWNNGVGAEFENCNNVTMQNCIVRNNGERGVGVGSGQNCYFNNLEVFGNNWRTNAKKIISHDAAGIKVFGSTKNVIIDNSEFYDNKCKAIWFDWNNEDYIIRNTIIRDNQEEGIMVEGSRKRAFIENCTIFNNVIGIKGYGHANVTIKYCNIYSNQTQLLFGQDGRIVPQDNDWETDSKDWKIMHSTICATDGSQEIFSFFEYANPNQPSSWASAEFYQTLHSDYNIFWHPKTKNIFPDGKTLTGTPLSFKEWQKRTDQDKNSVFEEQACP